MRFACMLLLVSTTALALNQYTILEVRLPVPSTICVTRVPSLPDKLNCHFPLVDAKANAARVVLFPFLGEDSENKGLRIEIRTRIGGIELTYDLHYSLNQGMTFIPNLHSEHVAGGGKITISTCRTYDANRGDQSFKCVTDPNCAETVPATGEFNSWVCKHSPMKLIGMVH